MKEASHDVAIRPRPARLLLLWLRETGLGLAIGILPLWYFFGSGNPVANAVGAGIGLLILALFSAKFRNRDEVVLVDGVLYGPTRFGGRERIELSKVAPGKIRPASRIVWGEGLRIEVDGGRVILLRKAAYAPQDWAALVDALRIETGGRLAVA